MKTKSSQVYRTKKAVDEPVGLFLKVVFSTIYHLFHDTEIVLGSTTSCCSEDSCFLENRTSSICTGHEEFACKGVKVSEAPGLEHEHIKQAVEQNKGNTK